MYAQVLMVALAIGAAPEPKNPALAEGIRLYKKLDYTGAINSLQRALTLDCSRAEMARVHVYYGLIQYLYDEVADAKSSFEAALRYDVNVHIPKSAPPGAQAAVKQLRARMEAAARPKTREASGTKARPAKIAVSPRDKAPERERARPESERDRPENAPAPEAAPADVSTSAGRARASEAADEDEDEGAEVVAVATTTPLTPRGGRRTLEARTELPGVVERGEPNGIQIETNTERGRSKVGPWLVLGSGGAAVTAGTILAIVATQTGRSSQDESLKWMVADARYDDYKTQLTAAVVSLGVGAVALGIGTWLFLSD